MNDASATEIGAWVTAAGLAGATEPELLRGFCERAAAAGLPLARAVVLIDTLHPVHEGHVFHWRRDPVPDERTVIEYGRTSEGSEHAASWRRSPFYHLLETGGSALRRNLARGDPADFPILEELRSQGQTDYLALIHRFAADGVIGEMDCVYSSWTTDAPSGFADGQVEALTGARSRPRLGGEVRLAGADRGHAGGDLPRPGRGTARPERPHRARRCRADRGGAVVLRPAGLHADHRHGAARAGHPAPERLRRGGHLRDPRGRRRRAEADRRRHARDLQGRRPGAGVPVRARGGGAACASGSRR